MHSLTINNSPTFQGAREIFARELEGSSKKLAKPIQEVLTPSELRAATLELMQDLNGMTFPKASANEAVGISKMFAEQATKAYGKTVEESIKTIIK